MVALITEFPPEPQGDPFPTKQFVSQHLTGNEVIGKLEVSLVDYRGNVVGRMFLFQQKRYGLRCDSYDRLHKLATAVRAVNGVGERLGLTFVEERLFRWTRHRFTGSSVDDSFCSFLATEAAANIRPITSWIPIANLEVEEAFRRFDR